LSEFRNKESRWTPNHRSIDNSLDSVFFPPLKLFAGPFRVRESLSGHLPAVLANKQDGISC
jgi:hypothetical protein